MTDAMTVGDDPVLDSLGAFLAASLLPQPSPPVNDNAPTQVLLAPEPVIVQQVPVPAQPEPVMVQPQAILVAPPLVIARPDLLFGGAGALVEPPVGPKGETKPSARPKAPSRRRVTLEWIAIIVGALAVAVVVRVAVIQSFVIPSESMHPTLQAGDRVLVNRLAYKAHAIRRGDVIVFDRPDNPALGTDTPAHLIKRVIALPGDTIVARDGVVFVDGRRLREPYLPAGTLTGNLNTSITIPAGHVWVMGDNRMNSTDSRIFGAIDVKLVVGRAFARVWPPSRIGFL